MTCICNPTSREVETDSPWDRPQSSTHPCPYTFWDREGWHQGYMVLVLRNCQSGMKRNPQVQLVWLLPPRQPDAAISSWRWRCEFQTDRALLEWNLFLPLCYILSEILHWLQPGQYQKNAGHLLAGLAPPEWPQRPVNFCPLLCKRHMVSFPSEFMSAFYVGCWVILVQASLCWHLVWSFAVLPEEFWTSLGFCFDYK